MDGVATRYDGAGQLKRGVLDRCGGREDGKDVLGRGDRGEDGVVEGVAVGGGKAQRAERRLSVPDRDLV